MSEKGKVMSFTGHRPKDLGGYHPEGEALELQCRVKAFLAKIVDSAVYHGFKEFLTGGALGTDQWAAQAVLNQRCNQAADIVSRIYQPFPGQEDTWPPASKEEYYTLLANSSVTCVTDVKPAMNKMHRAFGRRNQAMVDDSDWVVAVWTGKVPSGTFDCIERAIKANKPLAIYNPISDMEYRVKDHNVDKGPRDPAFFRVFSKITYNGQQVARSGQITGQRRLF
jgi:uncharacterized phage-like protein YoqJ